MCHPSKISPLIYHYGHLTVSWCWMFSQKKSCWLLPKWTIMPSCTFNVKISVHFWAEFWKKKTCVFLLKNSIPGGRNLLIFLEELQGECCSASQPLGPTFRGPHARCRPRPCLTIILRSSEGLFHACRGSQGLRRARGWRSTSMYGPLIILVNAQT